MRLRYALALLVFPIVVFAQTPAQPPAADAPWHFVVAGDSRNCGDVIMPAIAEAAKSNGARFYWHLGDWRAIYTFDEDMAQAAMMAGTPLQVRSYLKGAFKDALENQLKPFDERGVGVFVGIGNHETTWPMNRDAFVKAFKPYLDLTAIRDQRLKDDPSDTTVRTYYHVVTNGIDFITLDNATCDMFDDAQMTWLRKVLDRDAADASIRTVVAGMHAALPDSRSCGHSMGNYPSQQKSGREVYALLLALRDKNKKQVYVLASHSHFVMDNVYDSEYWRANGGVLPGWIVGTSGAVRYRLPETATPGPNVRTDVYGYLLATVSPNGSIAFEFRELTPKDIPADVVKKYSKNFVENFCFAANRDIRPQEGTCPPMSQCSTGSD
ncbi:MAG: metallophosphoesterase [Acidobacteriota bacterium]|nr:metallophosphoesterase [Acidobacteriota bacterium]